MFQARHLVCSKQDISCVPRTTFPVFQAGHSVFQAGHLVCSTQDISCVPSRTSLLFHAGHQPLLLPSTIAPPKSIENDENPKKNRLFFSKKTFRRQKIENCKSSEMRFAEVSRRSEPCSQSSSPPRRNSRSVNNARGFPWELSVC